MINIMKIAKNWPQIFYIKLFNKNSEKIVAKLRNGLNIITSGPADLSMLTEIWAIEEYNPEGFRISSEDIIIDIGAHLGFFSLYAATYAYNGKIYCFEPMPNTYKSLLKNIHNNNLKNITAFNCAVASDSSWHDFYPYKGHNGCHSLYNRGFNKTIKVKTINLEKIFKTNKIEYCDFLKMDCEGAEFEILINTKRAILKNVKFIVGELHEGLQKKYSTTDLLKHLKLNNFKVVIYHGCFYAKNKSYKKTYEK